MLNQLVTADLHTLELLDWFWISELLALPAEGGDVADDPGAVLAEAEADHPAALQPPAARLARVTPAGLSVVTRGRQAPGETRGEVTQRRAWGTNKLGILERDKKQTKISLLIAKIIPLNFLGFLELAGFNDGF